MHTDIRTTWGEEEGGRWEEEGGREGVPGVWQHAVVSSPKSVASTHVGAAQVPVSSLIAGPLHKKDDAALHA